VIYLAYGEEVLGRLQYVDDLELTLNHMESAICIVSNSPELQCGLEESDAEGAESPVGEEVQGQEGAVHP
jgi:hypothetical protein